MKKIAIITLNGYFNYGNRLQNYALQETVKKMGYSVETLRIEPEEPPVGLDIKVKQKLVSIKRNIFNRREDKSHNKRLQIFKEFSNDYINETTKIYDAESLNTVSDTYEKFIIGSDQVWNPHYNNTSSVYFAQFAEEHQRISYSASFGISNLPDEVIPNYKRWLNSMPYLSVREEDGAQIIKKLTNRESKILVDPTMLISKEEWMSISKPAPTNNKKYLLTYFLGGIPSEHKLKIKKIAHDNNLEIIELGNINFEEGYETGPAEFIDFIANAELFCTDSFHGVVFSILLERPFIVYERVSNYSMYSRMDTLLNKFNLNNLKEKNINYDHSVFEVDFSHVRKYLYREREKSISFLHSALSKNNHG